MKGKLVLLGMLFALIFSAQAAHADSWGRHGGGRDRDRYDRHDRHDRYDHDRHDGYRYHGRKGVYVRYEYPSFGKIVLNLPGASIIVSGKSKYYYCDGVYYRRGHGKYIVVAPPRDCLYC